MKKLRYIDSLRGFAILAVVFIHAGANSPLHDGLPAWFQEIIDYGQFGVQLFFVVSAFTLFFSLQHREDAGRFSNSSFFIRRFFRIAPMFYAGIAYYSIERFIGFNFIHGIIERPIPLDNLLANTFFVHGINPSWINSYVPGGWSITVEMTFYLFVPILFKKIKSLQKALWLFVLAVSIATSFHFLLQHHPFWDREYFLYCFFPNQFPVFALGIIAWFIVNHHKSISTKKILAVAAPAFIFFCFIPWFKHLAFSVVFLMVVVMFSKIEMRLFVNRFTVFLGKISYSMYITHFAGITVLRKLGLLTIFKVQNDADAIVNVLTGYVLLVVLSTLVSAFCYRFVELPFQRLGARVAAQVENKKLNRLEQSCS